MHGSTLYIGNLSHSLTKEKLTEILSQYGEVKDIKYIAPKRIAFAEMTKQLNAEVAKKELNGKRIEGFEMIVNEAKSKKTSSRRRR